MSVAYYDFEGTTGAYPSNPSGTYSGWNVYAAPAETATNLKISTNYAEIGTKSGQVPASTASYAGFYNNTPDLDGWQSICIRLHDYADNGLRIGFVSFDGWYTGIGVGITSDGRVWGAFNPSAWTGLHGSSLHRSAASTVPTEQWVRFAFKITAAGYQVLTYNTPSSTTASYDSGWVPVSTGATYVDQLQVALVSVSGAVSNTNIYLDDFRAADTDSTSFITGTFTLPEVTANAAATGTATGAAAASRIAPVAGSPAITADAVAVAGKVVAASAASSITAAGSADSSVVTTHDAEASGIATVSSDGAATLTRPLYATSIVTATALATMANQTTADGVVQAIGAARAVVEGETSPGFLYSTVAKHVLTN